MYVNDESLSVCQPNRAFYATERMEQEGCYSPIDGKPVVAGLPTSVLYGNIVITGFNSATGEDAPLSDGEMMDVMNYFQRESPCGSGREVALIVQNGLYGELREFLSHDSPSGADIEGGIDKEESLDEMLEQKTVVIDGGELGDEVDLDNIDR